jgi:hypothetical protein
MVGWRLSSAYILNHRHLPQVVLTRRYEGTQGWPTRLGYYLVYSKIVGIVFCFASSTANFRILENKNKALFTKLFSD